MTKEAIDSALIVKTSALGDIIHTFPAIDYLKRKFPNISIDWVVEKPFVELVQAHPQIDYIFCIDTKKWRKNLFSQETYSEISAFRKDLKKKSYDVVFDVQGNLKSGWVTWQAKSETKVGYGSKTVSEWPNLLFTNTKYDPPLHQNVREEVLFLVQQTIGDPPSLPTSQENFLLNISSVELETVDSLFEQKTGEKILVCPGSNWKNKQISEHSLCDFLHEIHSHMLCHFIFVWGNEKERQQACLLQKAFGNDSTVAPKMSLSTLQNAMHKADLVIAMDSLALHLAGTTSTKTFSLFGPSSAEKFRPYGPQQHSLQGPCPYGRVFERQCPLLRTCSTGQCLKGLSGHEIFADFYDWWRKRY